VRKLPLIITLLFIAFFTLAQQSPQGPATALNIAAEDQFVWGVRAFHEGLYNQALLDFERALTMRPEEARFRLWAGMASYYAGLNQAAFNHWQSMAGDATEGGAWLNSKIDTLAFRQSPFFNNVHSDSWAIRHEIIEQGRNARFLRPSSVRADPLTGGALVVGFGNNTVVRYDVNGTMLRLYRGQIAEFDGPYDVLPLADGSFFVSEFLANRISLVSELGFRLNVFGHTAESGGLRGPQFLAADDNGFLYVSDWGTRRVVKFDFNGNHIMDIGRPSAGFAGLRGPAGIALGPTELYVVDRSENVIYVFDHFGNYLRELGRGILVNPEGLTLYRNNYLIIADGRRVMMADLQQNIIIQLTDLEGRASQIMQVSFDRNNNLMAVDNRSGRLTFLSRLSDLYGGLFVNIPRVNIDNWPTITVEVAVQNRSGTSLVGLTEPNFLLRENGGEVARSRFNMPTYQVASLDIPLVGRLQGAVVVEASIDALTLNQQMARGVSDLYRAIEGRGSLNFFWAGEQPIAEQAAAGDLTALAIYNRRFAELASANWRFDSAIRLAANSLIPRTGRQALFFLTTGRDSLLAFEQYHFNELTAFLQNNNIAFYPIYVDMSSRSEVYDHIARETGGQSSFLHRPEGLGALLDIARSRPTGIYTITYQTDVNTSNFNQLNILELEVALGRESGSTRSGFFAPLR